ncbi:MAG TPA: hypothetical protein VHM90_03910 [Phycisphaerae bacterium]|nr:hypothetical protein [Phycisphaerae bacterium]
MRRVLAASILLFASSAVFADTVVTRNGVTRVGTVESRNESEVRLRVANDGMSTVMVIPMSQVSRIILGGPGAASQAASSQSQPAPSVAGNPPAAAPAPPSTAKPPTESELTRYSSHGFLAEMAAGAAGAGLDDPRRLPAAQHELWDRANTADAVGKRGETLDALRLLEAAMRDLPDGPARIDAIARGVRHEGFGAWMGRVHWEVIRAKYTNGQFDLADIREAERPVLIGLMKSNTTPALEPLKNYFPPVDEKTGQPAPFKPAQLSGITLTNAIELKEKSQLAAALLLAQLKLEPTMPQIDRVFLATQLATVNRVLNRARDLEPQARAALAKAEQQKRMEEAKAQRDAAINARKTAAPK